MIKKILYLIITYVLLFGIIVVNANDDKKISNLADFLNRDNFFVVSIKITHTSNIYLEKQTSNFKIIDEFFQFAKTVSITSQQEYNQAESSGYYITINGSTEGVPRDSYSFISDKGECGFYSPSMSGNPKAFYMIDNVAFIKHLDDYYNSFYDRVADDWALDSIDAAIELKILSKYLQRDYMGNITRTNFCELIIGLLNVQEPEKLSNMQQSETDTDIKKFDDCDNPFVMKLYLLGIVNGKGNNIFEANKNLTRQEAAKILYEIMKLYDLKYDISGYTTAEGEYSDFIRVADWAKDGVNAVSNAGIMKDNCYFQPDSPYTHEQAIVTVMRLFYKIISPPIIIDKHGISYTATAVLDLMPGDIHDPYLILTISSPNSSDTKSKFTFSDYKIKGYDGKLDVTDSHVYDKMFYIRIGGGFNLQ